MVFDLLVHFTVGALLVGIVGLCSKIDHKLKKEYNKMPETKKKKQDTISLVILSLFFALLLYYIISYLVTALTK